MRKSKYVKDNEIIFACKEKHNMAEACRELNMSKNTFISRAKKLGVYNPMTNAEASLIAGEATKNSIGFKTEDILDGKHPGYSSTKLSKRLIKEGYFDNSCSKCGISEWMGSPIIIELDYINGINTDNRISNLRMLCPNCHSQTPTYKSKNIVYRKKN